MTLIYHVCTIEFMQALQQNLQFHGHTERVIAWRHIGLNAMNPMDAG